MAWAVEASGSQTATISTEHSLATPTTIATYVFSVDTVNMVLGDAVELRAYEMIDATNYRECFKLTYQHAQAQPGKKFPPIDSTTQAKFTLKQTAGTGRVFPWRLRSI
jgi:hypothetical protein